MAKPKQPKSTSKMTDADRHKRFVAMAAEVGASEKPQDFDRAFQAVTRKKPA